MFSLWSSIISRLLLQIHTRSLLLHFFFFVSLVLQIKIVFSPSSSFWIYSSTNCSVSDPDQLKNAREDIKELLNTKFCHPILNSLPDPKERHDLVCENVKQVVCSICQTEQKVELLKSARIALSVWENTFADICKFFDDDTSKEQFHCDDCGICRVGGRDNFFHCQNCGACYATGLRDKHSCIENSTKNSCPVCYEISATEMHAELRVEVAILCNDCNKRSNALFHILGHKCAHCGSYNTRRISTPQDPVGDTE